MAEEENKQLASLETGDEFEDFPVEDWEAAPADGGDTNLWEEQWEDDDHADDDFSVQLKAEIEKRNAEK